MRAIRVSEAGGPEVLRIAEIDKPTPHPGQVLIRVEYAGLNFIETYQRSGLYKMNYPYTPGSEVGGTIVELGDKASSYKVGDRVVTANAIGGYAEYALADTDRVIPIPRNLDTDVATAALLQGMTAHYLATSTYVLKEGDLCVVHAAGGGTGALLVQIAKRQRASVIACVSNDEKAKIALNSGADMAINYVQKDFVEEVKAATAGTGVHVVYDSVGKDTFDKSLQCLRPRGLMVLYGQSSGPVGAIDPQILNARGSLYLTRTTLVHYTQTRNELLARANDLFEWIQNDTLIVRIDKRFPLGAVADAHAYLNGRHSKGKILLTVEHKD